MQIEKLTLEEYNSFLAYGEPTYSVAYKSSEMSIFDYNEYDQQPEATWISTLDSTTYPGMTFGYFDAP
jgi:hypothetical protein